MNNNLRGEIYSLGSAARIPYGRLSGLADRVRPILNKTPSALAPTRFLTFGWQWHNKMQTQILSGLTVQST